MGNYRNAAYIRELGVNIEMGNQYRNSHNEKRSTAGVFQHNRQPVEHFQLPVGELSRVLHPHGFFQRRDTRRGRRGEGGPGWATAGSHSRRARPPNGKTSVGRKGGIGFTTGRSGSTVKGASGMEKGNGEAETVCRMESGTGKWSGEDNSIRSNARGERLQFCAGTTEETDRTDPSRKGTGCGRKASGLVGEDMHSR